MGGDVGITYFIGGANQGEEEMLGRRRYDGGGWSVQEDR